MDNDDIFGMITASTEDLPSDKVKKEKEPKESSKKEEPKKEETAEAKKEPVTAKKGERKFKYPFQLYMGSRLRDVAGLFEDGKEYTGSDISRIMLGADEYFFSGKVEFDYIKETNTVVAMAIQHKKG